MAAIADYAAVIGTFKDVWADGVTEPYKNICPILTDAKLQPAEEVGGLYHVATRLTYEGGFTLAAARATPGEGGLAYVGPRAGQVTDAQVQGAQIHGRSRITYEAIAASAKDLSSNEPDAKKAVKQATMLVGKGLMEGTIKKCEALMIHGREGLGQLDTAVDPSNVVATTYEGVSGFAWDVSISPETWSEAIFMAFEGHTFDLLANASGLPSGTKLNTAPNLLLTGGVNQTGLVLIAVNPATPLTNGTASGRVLRLWHSSGTAGVLATGVIGGYTTLATTLNTQHLVFESGGLTSEFVGLSAMARNTGSLFGIDAASYGMWKGNSLTSVGNLRLAGLLRALAKPINAGAQGVKIRAVVPTELFAQFANDESTLRRYAAGTPDAKNGFDSIEMYLPMKSTLEILGHPMQKDGRVLCYVPDETMRVGSQDLDFVQRQAGRSRQQLLMEIADRPGSEMRLYGSFAPIVQTPRHMLRMSGVTY